MSARFHPYLCGRTAAEWVIIMTEVVAALVWDKNKFMICQRPENKSCGLLWEFAGGKVEAGETKEQALIREFQEELGITLSVGKAFTEVTHEYPHMTVHLTLFNATIADGIPQKLEHNDIRWITVSEIPNYEFCPADTEILSQIQDRVKTYNKLVRDRIPEIIEESGKICIAEILSDEDYLRMIDAKLDEELAEYHKDQNIEELADLLEVVRAAAIARGYTLKELERVRAEKAEKRFGRMIDKL